jgi:hypothetical protein
MHFKPQQAVIVLEERQVKSWHNKVSFDFSLECWMCLQAHQFETPSSLWSLRHLQTQKLEACASQIVARACDTYVRDSNSCSSASVQAIAMPNGSIEMFHTMFARSSRLLIGENEKVSIPPLLQCKQL